MGGLSITIQQVGDFAITAFIHNDSLVRNKTGKIAIDYRVVNESISHLPLYSLPKVRITHPIDFLNSHNVNWFEAKHKFRRKVVNEWLLSVFNDHCEIFNRDKLFAVSNFEEYIEYVEEYLSNVQIDKELIEDCDNTKEAIENYKNANSAKSKHKWQINTILFFGFVAAKIH